MRTSLAPRLAGAFAAVALAALSAAPVALAAPAGKMAHGKKMAHGRKMAAHTVYVCTKCKAFYSPATAKKMGYKDGMGHKLVKETKAPAGYMDGSKMKM